MRPVLRDCDTGRGTADFGSNASGNTDDAEIG